MTVEMFCDLIRAEIMYHIKRVEQIDRTMASVCSLNVEDLGDSDSEVDDDESEQS